MIEIRKVTNEVLFTSQHKTIKDCLEEANLQGANLQEANLWEANLQGANLQEANLWEANLQGANLQGANLQRAKLREAKLREANLQGADLQEADLREADLWEANLQEADLREANLQGADLVGAKHLVKIMNVKVGDKYWKRFNVGLNNRDYQFYVGLNCLGVAFADDERILCSGPGFYFASREWCDKNYWERPLEAIIRIPEGAKINEPWATDGKASADMIEILQVFDVASGKDVTELYRRKD